MDKDRHTIAATELSKFAYCPYQWYYERLYGRNELRRLETERNERLGLEDKRKEFFERGTDYHHDTFVKTGRRRRRAAAALVIIIATALYFLLKGGIVI